MFTNQQSACKLINISIGGKKIHNRRKCLPKWYKLSRVLIFVQFRAFRKIARNISRKVRFCAKYNTRNFFLKIYARNVFGKSQVCAKKDTRELKTTVGEEQWQHILTSEISLWQHILTSEISRGTLINFF